MIHGYQGYYCNIAWLRHCGDQKQNMRKKFMLLAWLIWDVFHRWSEAFTERTGDSAADMELGSFKANEVAGPEIAKTIDMPSGPIKSISQHGTAEHYQEVEGKRAMKVSGFHCMPKIKAMLKYTSACIRSDNRPDLKFLKRWPCHCHHLSQEEILLCVLLCLYIRPIYNHSCYLEDLQDDSMFKDG